MALTITNNSLTVNFTLDNGTQYDIDKAGMSIKKTLRNVVVFNGSEESKVSQKLKFRYTDVTSPVFANNTALYEALVGYKTTTGVTIGAVTVIDGANQLSVEDDGAIHVHIVDANAVEMVLEPNGSVPVTIQDQVTPIVITKFSLLEQATTTTGAVAIDDYIIPLTSVTGVIAGKYLSVFDPTSLRFSNFYVVSVASLNVTIDRPIDFAYPSGSYVDVQDTNMNVNGATTPVVFGVRNNAGASPPPGLALSVDIVRIIIQCITATSVDYDLFGDLTALARGILLRNRNGQTFNILNAKTTGELAGLMFDLNVYDVKQGTDGFISRLTFGGQSKMGAVQRLAIEEDLELIVQDNLTGLLKLEITAEGSVVQP